MHTDDLATVDVRTNECARVELGSRHLDLALHEVPYMTPNIAQNTLGWRLNPSSILILLSNQAHVANRFQKSAIAYNQGIAYRQGIWRCRHCILRGGRSINSALHKWAAWRHSFQALLSEKEKKHSLPGTSRKGAT